MKGIQAKDRFSVLGHPCRAVVVRGESVWARIEGQAGPEAEPIRAGKSIRVGDLSLVVRHVTSGVLRLDWDGQLALGLEA
ncbi:MAG: hypothetical protein ABIJ95_02380 [Pseudomonadota bacterium]